jgi:DMSO/TMAO reductase YedYZ heme-binding membrane subunit
VKTDPTFWLLARASGMTAYALLTATVLAGLVHKSRVRNVLDLHRFLPTLAFGMLALHGVALVLDRTVHMPLAGLLVPGASPYRPVAVALGVLACELMVVVAVSFSLRRRIGFRAWRRLHWLTYAVFLFATAHGIAAGTDSTRPWAQNVYLAAAAAVVFATAWRALARPALERRT